MVKRKCHMHPEDGERCKRKYYAPIKVKVQHSDTGRITYQTWHLCGLHYFLFLRDQGKGYYTWYHKRPHKKAFAIDYQTMSPMML